MSLSPEVLARVRHLHLAARHVVAGVRTGAHLAVQRGYEAEFVGYRPYVPPHPIKDVDWRVYGRTDRLVVRERRAERELVCELVLDASADIGSTAPKWQQAVLATAALACAVLANGDPVGLTVVAGRAPTRLPAARSQRQLARVLAVLAAAEPKGRADLAAALFSIGKRVKARTLLGLISDFMEPPDAWAPALGVMARNRVDVRGLHLYDSDELDLTGYGPARFLSPETGRRFAEDPDAIRAVFAETVVAWKAEVRESFVSQNARMWVLPAGASPVPAVAGWLGGRV